MFVPQLKYFSYNALKYMNSVKASAATAPKILKAVSSNDVFTKSIIIDKYL